VPLRHDPGHAQVDFGEALAEIAGVERKIHFFAMDLPHSDACFVRAHPAETAEAFELSAPPCGNRRERARVSAEPAARYVSVRSWSRRQGRR